MVSVRIGNNERKIESIDSDWINQEILNRRRANEPVCVQVLINYGEINIALLSEDCPKGQFKSGRVPNSAKEIFNLWDKMGLKSNDFQPNVLIDFLIKMNAYR